MLNGTDEISVKTSENDFVSSRVHTLETSTHVLAPSADYRTYLNVNSDPEFIAAAAAYAALDASSGHRRSETLHQCRSRAWFAIEEKTRRIRVVSNACRLRWCPVCANKRRNVIRHQVEAWAKDRPSLRFVTLTLRHSDKPLVAQLKMFDKFYRNFRRNKTVVQYVKGGVWFLEVKFNSDSQTWHPHYHMLLEGSYMPKSLLSKIWLDTTGDSMIVDIRSAGNHKRVAAYVAKYSSKPAALCSMQLDDVLCLMLSLHAKKLVSCFGSAAKLKLSAINRPEEGKYRKLCSWATLKTLYSFVSDARLVWQAFVDNTPLAEDVCLHETEAFLNNEYVEVETPPPKPFTPFFTEWQK